MVRVRKSPNMMSTTGRIPVMAAPTAIPVKPASEIGVSITRSVPNSSTKPESTLKGVPASATSSPRIQTRGSRRISSANASRTACAKVNSRLAGAGVDVTTSGINILLGFFWLRKWSSQGELHRFLDLRANLGLNFVQPGGIGESFFDQPGSQSLDRIAIALPVLLFFFRTVIIAIDVADMMACVAIGIAKEKRRAIAFPRLIHKLPGNRINSTHVLPINLRHARDSKCNGTRLDVAGSCLRIVCVLVVEVVFTDVNHGKLPELRQIHGLVEHPLSERALAEEADGNTAIAQMLRRKRRASCDTNAAAHDGVRPQIASIGIGDVHRSTFASAITSLFAEQLGEHAIR